ncbi:Tyrosine recombinase XerC [Paraburkholderia nemoris]|jgi:integrase|uniref:tyrosine-type recombinase/integrase n=1 Tax=Paraburkholderia nemoris TaxID=2793076 RepID=UPI001912AA3A|nr:tyrosine-type recombinase/integrase [Paraburkholderia nemoris]MBK5153446.1 tyrosine-type recombinase/integrase [Burkholderia sp. R-69608]CAE6965533.1 Tyrosine recombinase XerC [Paraburkholderia nemoris]
MENDNELSVLVEGVMSRGARIGLADATQKYYRACCRVVVRFCQTRESARLTDAILVEFLAAMDERHRRGEIGEVMRSALEKSARMLLEFERTGAVNWRRRRPASGLRDASAMVLDAFSKSACGELSAGSVRLLVLEVRQFLRHLDALGRDLPAVNIEDVREYLVVARPRHNAGMGNTVWAIKRFFAFANQRGLTALRVEALLARVGPRRVRALPCFTAEETANIVAAIETGSPNGKRDYAMVVLALSTGLRGGDIAALRLDEIDWRRDEIRMIQHKTSAAVTLPLLAQVGNAIADWLLSGRPECEAPEVFVRLKAPFVKLTGPTGALLMARWLDKAGVAHHAGDGKTFHALRRTAGTRLVESGAELALTAQVLGHANVDSSRRYIALADVSLRDCCLPLDSLVCTREGLR